MTPPDDNDSEGPRSLEFEPGDLAATRVPLARDPELRLHHTHAEPLAAEIAVILDRLITDRYTFVIIAVGPAPNRFVQFLTEDGTTLWGEAVGERHAEDLDARQSLELLRLGWRSPDEEPKHAGNYWRRWEPPDILDAAQLAALTLIKVHGLDHPERAELVAHPTHNAPGFVRPPKHEAG